MSDTIYRPKGNPSCPAHYPRPHRRCPRCAENLARMAELRAERKRRMFRAHGVVEAPGGRYFKCQLPRGHTGICKGKMLPAKSPVTPVKPVAALHSDAGRAPTTIADDLPF